MTLERRDLMRIDLDPASLDGMTLNEALRLKEEVAYSLASMKAKVDAAVHRQRATGEYADSDWMARIKTAIRIYGAKDQQLNRKISALRREDNAQIKFNERFVSAAKETLPPETYASLVHCCQQ